MVTAYRAILRREPQNSEVKNTRFALRDSGTFDLLRDMIESDEFVQQILPGLVATRTEFSAPNPVFFLHLRKTGGTSIRKAISKALGVPALNLYQAWPGPDRFRHSFWPYWAGHADVGYFPSTHRGITVFRESRSRMLSRYRQQEARSASGVRHGWEYSGHPLPRRPKPANFYSWLHSRSGRGSGSTALHFSIVRHFLPFAGAQGPRELANEEVNRLGDLPRSYIDSALEEGMKRFDAAAWLHDEAGLLGAISQITGSTVTSLPKENTFESKQYEYPIVRLTREDHTVLKSVAEADAQVTTVARRQGLINPLRQSEADELFEHSASRLGFEI